MFTDLGGLRSITPLGTPATGGEIKERHQIQLLTNTDESGTTSGHLVPIYAPTKVKPRNLRRFQSSSPPAPYTDEYYGFELEVSCEVHIRLDHIRMAGDKLRAAVPEVGSIVEPAVPTVFEAGELIGYTDGTPPAPPGEDRAFSFDYAVYNAEHENQYVNMERYRTTNELRNSLTSVCGNTYYDEAQAAAFAALLGYDGNSAGGDCRSAARDVPGALAGGWFRRGAAEKEPGWRMAIATEFDGAIRMNVDPFNQYFFWPIETTGTVNLDPALAVGRGPYCYTDNLNEFWFTLSSDGWQLSMAEQAGDCTGATPSVYPVVWER